MPFLYLQFLYIILNYREITLIKEPNDEPIYGTLPVIGCHISHDPVVAPSYPVPRCSTAPGLCDRLRKSKNNYFYCRWQDSGTMELDGTGSCLDVLPRARHLHLCLQIMRKMQNRTQKISTAKISVLLTLYWPELKNPGFAPIFGERCELTGQFTMVTRTLESHQPGA